MQAIGSRLASCFGGRKPPATGFQHGVASFDPTTDAVIIWTRYTPGAAPAAAAAAVAGSKGAADDAAAAPPNGVSAELEVPVGWQVSEREDFSSLVDSGTAVATAARDWTVAVDVGGLQPGSKYHYRFSRGKEHSVAGVTRTAPARPEEALFASVSCANWGFGRFHAYQLLSQVDRLDFVLHCGDYVYEYGEGDTFPTKAQLARRGLRPTHRCASLADFRERHACYRTDPALQELHRRVPMIAVNDDHDIADDAHVRGSEQFEGSRQEWEERKAAGLKAFSEWVPMRGVRPSSADPEAAHRTLEWGDLMTLMLVESRVSHRSLPFSMEGTEFYRQTALKDPKEWDDDAIRAARQDLLLQLADPERRMLGQGQVADLAADVRQSVAAGTPWQVFLSQTVFSTIRAPMLRESVHLQPRLLAWICKRALRFATSMGRAGEESAQLARMYLGMGAYGVPMNPDAWDGYQAEREQVIEALAAEGANPIVLAGDSHNAWAHVLRDAAGRRLGAEFDAPAITAIGAFEDIWSRFATRVGRLAKLFPLYVFTPWVEDSLHAANPDTLKYCNLAGRGFVLCHVTRRRWHAEYHFVSSVQKRLFKHYCGAAFDVEAGSPGHVRKGLRYLSIGGKIPRRERPRRSALLRLLRGSREIGKDIAA